MVLTPSEHYYGDSYVKASGLKKPQRLSQRGKLVLKVIIIGQLVPSTKNVIHHRK